MDLTKDVKSVERGRRRQATILDLKSKTRMVSWELDAGTDENAQVLTRAHIHPCKHTPARNIPPRATYPRTPRWPRPCVRLRPNQSPSEARAETALIPAGVGGPPAPVCRASGGGGGGGGANRLHFTGATAATDRVSPAPLRGMTWLLVVVVSRAFGAFGPAVDFRCHFRPSWRLVFT